MGLSSVILAVRKVLHLLFVDGVFSSLDGENPLRGSLPMLKIKSNSNGYDTVDVYSRRG